MINSEFIVGYGMIISKEEGEKLFEELVQSAKDEYDVSDFLFPINNVTGEPEEYFFGEIREDASSEAGFFIKVVDMYADKIINSAYLETILIPRAEKLIEWKPELYFINHIF